MAKAPGEPGIGAQFTFQGEFIVFSPVNDVSGDSENVFLSENCTMDYLSICLLYHVIRRQAFKSLIKNASK